MDLVTGLARLVGREADGDDLGIGEAHGRNHRSVESATMAGDRFGDHRRAPGEVAVVEMIGVDREKLDVRGDVRLLEGDQNFWAQKR